MKKIDYIIDFKKELSLSKLANNQWDIFISAYNKSDRVKIVYEKVSATKKIWIIIPEYHFPTSEYPTEEKVIGDDFSESALIINTIGKIFDTNVDINTKICIDITGFMRPHIIFLIKYLQVREIHNYDIIYSEPRYYSNKSETFFSISDVEEVRQIDGYGGNHNIDTKNDILILGASYDHNLMAHVVLNKNSARLIIIHSFPSLSADMYQESLLRLSRVSDITSKISSEDTYYIAANDPFVIANELSIIFENLTAKLEITNLYMCPLATKPQSLGFSLFYLKELVDRPASIIFPFSTLYSQETSKGIGHIWLYPINL